MKPFDCEEADELMVGTAPKLQILSLVWYFPDNNCFNLCFYYSVKPKKRTMLLLRGPWNS